MEFRCANDALVTAMTSALAIPSAARNLIAADFIALSPSVCAQVGCAQVGRAKCQTTLSTRSEGLRRSHLGQIGAPGVLITCRVANGLFALREQ